MQKKCCKYYYVMLKMLIVVPIIGQINIFLVKFNETIKINWCWRPKRVIIVLGAQELFSNISLWFWIFCVAIWVLEILIKPSELPTKSMYKPEFLFFGFTHCIIRIATILDIRLIKTLFEKMSWPCASTHNACWKTCFFICLLVEHSAVTGCLF